jgi:CubicO group peptidase (beta-lactamase class C family)
MPESSPAVVSGFVAPGFERVQEAFEANFTRRGDVGGAFAAYVDGELVVDLWGGVADAATGASWEEDTLQLIFSGTKGITAAAMLLLVDRNELRLSEPVATYWPEFGQADKKDITIAEVLTHRTGLSALDGELENDFLLDPEGMAAVLARQAPNWPATRRIAYHPLTYGWLCGEIVRRVTGTTIGRFVRSEIAEPLGADIWIGLPPELEPRVSSIRMHDEFRDLRSIVCAGPGGQRYTNPPFFDEPLIWNERPFHEAEIAGVNGIADARGMAALYACLANGGTLGGTRLLSTETAALAPAVLARGEDALSGENLAFSTGFELQTELALLGPAITAFGHGGAGGSIHGAWPRQRVGFSYLMNEMRDIDDDRSRVPLAALYAAL